jgi:hypothetical protein
LHANGDPHPNVYVGVWADAWEGLVSGPSKADGKYDVNLGGIPPGKFKVAVVRLESCTQREGYSTAVYCERLSNVVEVTTTANCTGDNAVQAPQVNFTGP